MTEVEEGRSLESEEISAEKPKKRKRKFVSMDDDDDHVLIPSRLYKGVTLSLMNPLYLLRLGPGNIRWGSRERLCSLLQKLVRQHNWAEASGVLSVLLKGTCNVVSCSTLNRLKFSVSMELIKHVQGNHVKLTRIRDIYEIWMRRIRSKRVRLEERLLVQLEFILLYLMHGNVEDAHQAALSLMKENKLTNHPMSNLIIGLTFFQLWYSNLPEEVKLKDLDQGISSQSETSEERFSNQVENTEGNNEFYSHEAHSSLQYDSDTSVMNGKRIAAEASNKPQIELSAKIDVNPQSKSLTQDVQQQSFQSNSTGNDICFYDYGSYMPDPSIFSALEGLESWLLPVRLPHSSEKLIHLHRQMLNNHYKDAMKYFQLALYSTPPVLTALLPLIQLLLIGGQVNEALREIEKFCNSLNAPFPFRLKASLLGCFNSNDSVLLATSFEDILKKDPTCHLSLAKLVSMHQNGDYSPESLVEMIALHLDAAYAESETWGEFALCFLKLSQYGEDRLSACLNGKENKPKPKYSFRYNRTPEIFTVGSSGKAWRLRCRWWLMRHFSKKMLASEINSGDLQLLTYKAACASHIYGHGIDYVVKAYARVKEVNNRDLLLFLQNHFQNSVRIFLNFKDRSE
ncbi:hypothetical protein SLE2022_344240 [Rubroshorea leprosula]